MRASVFAVMPFGLPQLAFFSSGDSHSRKVLVRRVSGAERKLGTCAGAGAAAKLHTLGIILSVTSY
jgi:hypothetical protein